MQAKHCPNVDVKAYYSKRVGSFEVEVNEIVVIPSWSANLFLCGADRDVWIREDARSGQARSLTSLGFMLNQQELYDM